MSDTKNQDVIETAHQIPPIQSQPTGDATGRLIPYKNIPALLAYYFGVFSLIPFLGAILGIVAFVLGIMGLSKAKKHPEVKGKVHAWVGIIMGCLFSLGYFALSIYILDAISDLLYLRESR